MQKRNDEELSTISYEKQLRFVTMEDVLGDQLEHNHVLYNPMLPKERREYNIKVATEFHFKHKSLTDDDLDLLSTFGMNELSDFIEMYKKILALN